MCFKKHCVLMQDNSNSNSLNQAVDIIMSAFSAGFYSGYRIIRIHTLNLIRNINILEEFECTFGDRYS